MKPIKEYEGLYSATEDGLIYSHKSKKFLKPFSQYGKARPVYLAVCLYKDNKKAVKLVHKIIANTLIKNPNNLPVIDHISRDRLDNSVKNLRWCTHAQNGHNKMKNSSISGKVPTSKYKGVTWEKAQKKWGVYISYNGTKKTVGRFSTEDEAALKYNEASKKYHGEFGYINEIK